MININIQEGDVQCTITDMGSINMTKKSSSKQKSLQFIITPHDHQKTKDKKVDGSLLGPLMSGFGLENIFTTLHVSILSTEP